jgi:hypothetical protein
MEMDFYDRKRMNSSRTGELYLFVADAPELVSGVYRSLGAARGRVNYIRQGHPYTIYRIMTSGNGRGVLTEIEHGLTGPRRKK